LPAPRMGFVAELKERLRADLNSAIRARDQVRMRTLRLALTSITNEEVAGPSARELSDDEVVRVLTREAKKRREAAEAFSAAGRTDQAAAAGAEGGGLRRARRQRRVRPGPGHEDGAPQGRRPGRRGPRRRRGPAPPVQLTAGQAMAQVGWSGTGRRASYGAGGVVGNGSP